VAGSGSQPELDRPSRVACSDLLAHQPRLAGGNDTRNWLALICIRCVVVGPAGGGK